MKRKRCFISNESETFRDIIKINGEMLRYIFTITTNTQLVPNKYQQVPTSSNKYQQAPTSTNKHQSVSISHQKIKHLKENEHGKNEIRNCNRQR